ncbi:MAG TPA: matrixin family metalloprotease, partial [Chromatiales bacterium]|nr:matrixin family metalloprotease [Chromatiales bacterium]
MDEAKRRIARVFTLFLLALTGSLHAADKPAICFAPGTPPEYAASITRQFSRAGHSLGLVQSFRTGARWTSTATDGGGLRQGEPITLTWSYVPDGTQIGGSAGEPAAPSNLHAWLDGLYGSQAVWHALFERVFRRWEALTGIHYVYEPNDDGAPLGLAGGVLGVRGDVRIGAHPIDGDFGILAYNFYPPGGDMVIDSGDRFFNDTSNDSLKFRNVLAHEHGHGLGLAHVCPIDRTKLMEPYLSTRFDGPQFDDRAGAQSLYGDPREDNDRLTAASLLGTLGAGDSLSVDALSIDGATDTDLFALTLPAGARLSVQVDPGVHLPYREGPQNANGSCSTSNLFDPRVRRDLGLELLDAAGRNIALADAAGVGQPEALSGVTVSAPGTYYLRVYSDDAGSALQAYALSVDVSGGAPPPASADLGLTLAD